MPGNCNPTWLSLAEKWKHRNKNCRINLFRGHGKPALLWARHGLAPTNDPHKSGTEIINMLIETRAKGGNLFLYAGPKPDGEIQIEQEALLREITLWNLVNTEAVHDILAWDIIKEDDIWFTCSKDKKTVYAFV